MKLRDIMSQNVVTISSNTSIADAKRIMDAHRIKRLPVVDKGELVGIVTERGLEKVSPSKATSLTVWELSYLLEKTTVKEIMEKQMVTGGPDMDAEEAITLAQANKVGSMVVLEKGHVVGIVTTTDFFYKIINPLLGIRTPGTRVEVEGGGEGKKLEDLIGTINQLGYKFSSVHIEVEPDKTEKDVCFHVDSDDVAKLLSAFKDKGYAAAIRKR
jgi:acetoin utilization protein AcuB